MLHLDSRLSPDRSRPGGRQAQSTAVGELTGQGGDKHGHGGAGGFTDDVDDVVRWPGAQEGEAALVLEHAGTSETRGSNALPKLFTSEDGGPNKTCHSSFSSSAHNLGEHPSEPD